MLYSFECPIGYSMNFEILKETLLYGGVAQLGEHLPCKQGVRSSILLISTKGGHYGHLNGLIAQVVRAHA